MGVEERVGGGEEREVDDGEGGGEVVCHVIRGLHDGVVGGRDGGVWVGGGEGFDASYVGGVKLGGRWGPGSHGQTMIYYRSKLRTQKYIVRWKKEGGDWGEEKR